ncbi:MAG TPA: hypothetical protein QGG47_16575 [Acidobacteriota bacterium]|nr:hypothetical protein [Acidobacteriota bacterium]
MARGDGPNVTTLDATARQGTLGRREFLRAAGESVAGFAVGAGAVGTAVRELAKERTVRLRLYDGATSSYNARGTSFGGTQRDASAGVGVRYRRVEDGVGAQFSGVTGANGSLDALSDDPDAPITVFGEGIVEYTFTLRQLQDNGYWDETAGRFYFFIIPETELWIFKHFTYGGYLGHREKFVRSWKRGAKIKYRSTVAADTRLLNRYVRNFYDAVGIIDVNPRSKSGRFVLTDTEAIGNHYVVKMIPLGAFFAGMGNPMTGGELEYSMPLRTRKLEEGVVHHEICHGLGLSAHMKPRESKLMKVAVADPVPVPTETDARALRLAVNLAGMPLPDRPRK